MAKISTGQSFNAGDQVTSTKLNNIVGTAFLDSDSVTGTTLNLTSGQLKVATNGITDNELNANSVTTAKIQNDAVTYDKIQNVAANSVIGNTTVSTATPTNVSILDEDDMASDSATSLATQQSIKAYVDANTTVGLELQAKASFEGITTVTRNTNAEVNIASVVRTGTGSYTVTFTSAVTDPVVSLGIGYLNGTYRDRSAYFLKDSLGNTVYSGSVTSIEIITEDVNSPRDADVVQILVF